MQEGQRLRPGTAPRQGSGTGPGIGRGIGGSVKAMIEDATGGQGGSEIQFRTPPSTARFQNGGRERGEDIPSTPIEQTLLIYSALCAYQNSQ